MAEATEGRKRKGIDHPFEENGGDQKTGGTEEAATKKHRGKHNPNFAKTAAQQEAELRRELLMENRKEKADRIKRDLFEESDEEAPEAKEKAPRAEIARRKPRNFEGNDDDDVGTRRRLPRNALKQVEGEEEGPEEQFDEKGVQLEPFNLRAEMEEGYFDKDGNYVESRRKDERPVRDAWLDEVDERLQTGNKEKEEGARQPAAEEDEDDGPPVDLPALKRDVLKYLNPNETPLQALKRLNQEKKKDDFNRLTEAADACNSNGYYEVYSETREKIEKSLTSNEKIWEYKNLRGDQQVFGPFTVAQMLDWYNSGYFQGATVMNVRKVGDKAWKRSDALDWTALSSTATE